jgi:hypothetical protein
MITALVSAVFAVGCTSRDDSAETDSTEVQPTPVAEVQPADGNDAEPTPIDAQAAIAAASAAIGADDLDSIMISGTANNVSFGQTPNINGPYDGMGTEINEYVRMIDLDPAAPRSFATGSTFEGFRGGPPEPGRYNLNVPPESGWAQQMEIWMSPWGFLKGAAANNATATSETI